LRKLAHSSVLAVSFTGELFVIFIVWQGEGVYGIGRYV
jgi:hypothetical protein